MSNQGKFLGLPYDLSRPSKRKIKNRTWDPKNPKLFVPKAYGWGYSINFAHLLRRH